MKAVVGAVKAVFGLNRRAIDRQLALVCLVVAVALRVWDPAPVETLRLKTFDYYQWLWPWDQPGNTVTIVDIDEESLAVVGQWPWPRTIIAELIEKLMAAGAVAVAFDIVFPEPDRMSASSIAGALERLDPKVTQFLRGLPSNDQVLARTLKRSRVVLGQSTVERRKEGQAKDLKTAPLAEIGGDPRPFTFTYDGIVRNIPELEQAALGLGMITLSREPDAVARRVAAILQVDGKLFPTLSIELLRVATGQEALGVKTDEAGIKSLVVARVEVPTDPNGRLWVHFAPHSRDRYVSAKDVLGGSAPADRLAGKLIFVGTSAVGLQDIKATPLQSGVPGVEVHALLLENILSKHLLTRPHNAIGAELLVIILTSILLIIFVPRWGAVRTIIVGTIGAAIYAGTVTYLYLQEGLLIDLTFPMLATFAVYVLLAYLNYIREEAQKRQIRTAFSHYMSPALVEQLAGHPEKLKLGGEMKELSLLFCDIRGFTTISEQYDAEGLTRVINRFLTPMTGIILDRQGTIDKYIGDCIMAFWNAPLDDPDHARHACNAALTMIQELGGLNEIWRREAEADGSKYLPIDIGIGINSGVCAVGNMGSDQRFDYSVLGDDVNLASRLEGQTKAYGVHIIIGENTRAQATDFAALELDLIQVKGKTRPVRVYALLGDPDEAVSGAFHALAEVHAAMLTAYRAQDWDATRRLIDDCVAAAGTWRGSGALDALYALYRNRVEEFSAAPPGADWDGVYTAQTK
ncbi:MAG: adenylate/guanylate cyclase domain-containing protein [Alphaproteobacteria bacterium]|nr:adenylate/guanylate cyclase domain-containing protein [Alphaproteobacteria bacterium]